MPREKNPVRRLVVTLFIFAIGLGILTVVVMAPGRQNPAPPAASESQPQTEQAAQPGESDSADELASETAQQQSDPIAQTSASPVDEAAETADFEGADDVPTMSANDVPPVEPGAFEGLVPRTYPAAAEFSPIGGLDAEAGDTMQLTFTPYGAGVESITLARYYKTVKKREHYEVQEEQVISTAVGPLTVVSLAAVGVEINAPGVDDPFVDLRTTSAGSWWRELSPGAFEAILENASGDPVARITKRYSIREGSYEIDVEQRFENLTDQPLPIRWYQYGPVDMPVGAAGYGGDKRRLSLGGVPQGRTLPDRIGGIYSRTKVMKRVDKAGPGGALLWPAPNQDASLTWIALKNRYFTFAIVRDFSDAELSASRPDLSLDQVQDIYAIALGQKNGGMFDGRVLALQLNGPLLEAPPRGAVNLSISAYAGPTSETSIDQSPGPKLAGLDRVVIYNFGGPCAFCTFQWLTHVLLWFLNIVHSYVVFDWALAIMVLVLVVRTLLHPITKKSQIGMQRFSKHMQELQPKMEKIKERYRNDPKKQQQELLKLQREEGMGLQHMLGCFPMFLQTPVWIALYAMLFFVFELRHEAAFFGLFQEVTGGKWDFLADLSAPDNFISFGHTIVTLPLFGELDSINILPFFLGLVFFLQQKYLTPPTSANLTPEQKSQQKIIKVMMVIMFPVVMYNAPSGLSIYFITNSTLGIFESRYIRAHIDQMDLTPKKKPQPGRKRVANQATPAAPFSKSKELKSGPSYKQRRKK